MKQFDIDAYLEGRLSGSALESFETEMSNNPQLRERVNYLRQLTDDIEMQSIDDEVRSILQGKETVAKKSNGMGRWLGLLAGLVVIIVTINFFWKNMNEKDEQSPIPIEQQYATPTDGTKPTQNEPEGNKGNPPIENSKPTYKESSTPEKQPANNNQQPTRPIAQNTPPIDLPPPLHPSPKVRGQNSDNDRWQALLDKIWYTEFPPANTMFNAPFTEAGDLIKERNFKKAFVKLELQEMKMEANDTLRFLKGYCLLEMGEGGDAIRYFEQIKNPPSGWQGHLQWYKALGILISKGIPDAIPAFKEIAANSTHPFQQQSAKALEVLE